MSDLPTWLETQRAMLAAMTEGPWAVYGCKAVPLPHGNFHVCEVGMGIDYTPAVYGTGDGTSRDADAAGIVAMRNNYARVLNVVEAAAQVQAFLDDGQEMYSLAREDVIMARHRLVAALARLAGGGT